MKRFLTLALCILITLSLFGCSAAEQTPAKSITENGYTVEFVEIKEVTVDGKTVYAAVFTFENASGKPVTLVGSGLMIKAERDGQSVSLSPVVFDQSGVSVNPANDLLASGTSLTVECYMEGTAEGVAFTLSIGDKAVTFDPSASGGSMSLFVLIQNFLILNWRQVVMWIVGATLIFLAIHKEMEPSLLLPMGFGAILVNIPGADAALEHGPLASLFNAGIANELFPLLLFIGIGAMIDFGPLLSNPKLMIFGAAAQFGIFFTLCLASIFFPDIKDAASIAIIGAADGPTAIAVANVLHSKYLGAIMVAAYSYMALVPIIQPPVIRLLTTKKERRIRMEYKAAGVSKLTRILFPIATTVIVGMFAPNAVSLVGFLMFGNLLRECGVLDSLSETAQKVLANLITLFLGLTIAYQMKADDFLKVDTLLIMGLGLVAFVMDTAGGVLFAKLLNVFSKKKINPMIGAAGISAFPMSGRIVHKMGLEEDPQNFLLMHSIGVNVSGQVASVIAGGLILNFFL